MRKPTNPTPSFSIFLYGPSGSGKSSVGSQLARDLNLPFIDIDLEIESHSGLTIPEIFTREGESGFREREKQTLEKAVGTKEAVVALGGGALTVPDNRAWVEEHGVVVTLNASFDTLLSRLNSDLVQRPLIAASPDQEGGNNAEDNLKEYLARRKEHYASFLHQVDTDAKNPGEIAWEVQVRTGAFHLRAMAGPKHPGYDVRVQAGGLDHLGTMLKARALRGPVVLVTDKNVGALYGDRASGSLRAAGFQTGVVTIQPGETTKNLATISQLWDAFLSARIERGSTVVALGGGVVGDLAGFAAATFLRGVSWVAVPTSLLAMVDASMGGKTGADLLQGKNLIGAFHPPRFVLADSQVLGTLPEVEFTNGMAEVLKHGIIADSDLFEECLRLDRNQNPAALDALVRRGMAVKVKFIETDPYEKGIRAALNYGHTFGHGIELVSNFHIRHGEAVAIGMVLEARLAERHGLAEKGLTDRIAKALQQLGLPVDPPPGLEPDAIISAMQRDKKVAGGVVRFALPLAIGDVRVGVEIEGWEELLRAY